MKILFGFQFLAGIILVLLSPALGHILESFDVAERGGGTLFFTYFIGGTLSTLTISWLPRFLSSRVILQVSSLLACLGLLGFTMTANFWTAVFFYFVVGMANGILISFPGALLANLYREESGRMMSFLYACFAVGVTLCPFVAGFILHRGVPWQWIFQGIAVLCLAYTFLAFFFSLPAMQETEGLRWSTLQEARKGDGGLLLGAVLLNILYVGGETSVIGWVVYYLQNVFTSDTSVFRASRVLTYFWLFMIFGRVMTGFAVERAGSFRTLLFLISGGILTWICAMLSGDLVTAEVLFALTGLFFSGQFPVIASFAGRFPLRYTGLAFSVILAGGGLGGALFPFFVGWIAEKEGLQVGLASALSTLFVMFALLWFLKRRGAVD